MIDTIVFDLGGVLIDWNPEYLYKKIFKDEKERQHFLTNICDSDWNECQDAGRPLQEATRMLIDQYPNYANEIKAYYGRWEEMLGGQIEGTVEILKSIYDSKKFPLFALTNWSHETFPIALSKYSFLQLFDNIVVSGIEKTRKPFPEIYQLLLDRFELDASKTLFIDDNERNIIAAKEFGFQTILFKDPNQLKSSLNEIDGIKV